MGEKSVWVWYLPVFFEALARLVARLKSIGTNRALIKAGVDGAGVGVAWIDGEARGLAAPQWGPRLQLLQAAGIEPIPWYFVYGTDDAAEYGAILRSLLAYDAPEIVLNVEVAEDTIWESASDQRVGEYVEGLRDYLRAHGFTPLIGFSSVAHWAGGGGAWFPYEAFARHCDGTNYPQVYWPLDVADDLYWSNERTPREGEKVVPILPLGDRSLILALATAAVERVPNLAGFSYWEAGNVGADLAALGEAFVLLDGVQPSESLRPSYDEPQIRTAIGAYFAALPAWARGLPDQVWAWRADFTAIDPGLPADVWGLSWEYGDLWGDNSGALHLVQAELSARVRALAVRV